MAGGHFSRDENIFVYAFDQRSPAKAAKAADLIERGVTSRTGIVSYQVVQEF